MYFTWWKFMVTFIPWLLYPPLENPTVPTEQKAIGPQRWPGCFGEENLLPLLGTEQFLGHPAHSLVIIPTTHSKLLRKEESYLFICGLFNNAVCSSDYKVSAGMMTNE
jgi:hypothetical protein